MKKILTFCAALLLSLALLTAKEPTFKYGPWIQSVTETGFSVLFRTSIDVMAWVEVAPDDGTPFEAASRRCYYQTVAGRRYCGTKHCVKIIAFNSYIRNRARFVLSAINLRILSFQAVFRLQFTIHIPQIARKDYSCRNIIATKWL